MTIRPITVQKSTYALCITLSVTGPLDLTAQNTCADLTILSVQYAAFNDTTIEVVAQATEGSFFSYPQFSLVTSANDTITNEQVAFFGIGEGPQTHSSVLVQGHDLPASPFAGTLLFTYSGPGEENFCTFPFTGSLCPPPPCVDMQVHVHRIALPPLLTTAFTWTIHDEWNVTVGSGSLAIDDENGQLALSDLCLPPGHYTLDLQQNDAVGDQFNFGVTQRNFTVAGPIGVLDAGGGASLPFTLHAQCFVGGNGIDERPPELPTVLLNGRSLTISNANGSALGTIEILDVTGRFVRGTASSSSTTSFDLSDLSRGMHIVRTASTASGWKAQRIILQ